MSAVHLDVSGLQLERALAAHQERVAQALAVAVDEVAVQQLNATAQRLREQQEAHARVYFERLHLEFRGMHARREP